MRPLALLILLVGCGRSGESHPASVAVLDALRVERTVRLAATPDGWPSDTDCDGLLWASEARAAGVKVDLGEAVDATGMLHRRPLTSGECYPAESASTISNDMLWGYVVGADVAAVAAMADYGQAHGWVMGQPLRDAVRVVAKPNLIVAIGRRTGRAYGRVPCALTPPIADYERHLQALAGVACGQHPAAADNGDALAVAVAGDTDSAANLLLAPNYTAPSYVRGSPAYANIYWLFAAAVALGEVSRGK